MCPGTWTHSAVLQELDSEDTADQTCDQRKTPAGPRTPRVEQSKGGGLHGTEGTLRDDHLSDGGGTPPRDPSPALIERILGSLQLQSPDASGLEVERLRKRIVRALRVHIEAVKSRPPRPSVAREALPYLLHRIRPDVLDTPTATADASDETRAALLFRATLAQMNTIKKLAMRNGTVRDLTGARLVLGLLRRAGGKGPDAASSSASESSPVEADVLSHVHVARSDAEACDALRDPERVAFVARASLTPAQMQEYAPFRPAAELVTALRGGSGPAYAHVLPGYLPTAPAAIMQYAVSAVTEGLANANARFFDDTIVSVPQHFRKYASGGTDEGLYFRDRATSSFLASVFHFIQGHAPTPVYLAGWDLYHAHIFPVVTSTDVDESGGGVADIDVGLLFHAKEFPWEYGTYGIRNDPRWGSLTSVVEPDYHWRNYLWLGSTNEVYLLDSSAPDFPRELVGGEQFHTVNERAFARRQLGSVNYLPGLMSGEDASTVPDVVTRAGRAGVDACVHCAGDAVGVLAGHADHRAVVDQAVAFIARSPRSASDVICMLNDAFTPDFRVMTAATQADRIRIVEKLDLFELRECAGLFSDPPSGCAERVARVSPALRSEIGPVVLARLEAQERRLQETFHEELEELVAKGADWRVASQALTTTLLPTSTSYSAYHSSHLLQVALKEFRSEEMLRSYPLAREPSMPLAHALLAQVDYRADLALLVLDAEGAGATREAAMARARAHQEREWEVLGAFV